MFCFSGCHSARNDNQKNNYKYGIRQIRLGAAAERAVTSFVPGVLIYPKGMSVKIGRCSHELHAQVLAKKPIFLYLIGTAIDRDVMRAGDDREITVRNSTNCLTVVPVWRQFHLRSRVGLGNRGTYANFDHTSRAG